MVAVKDRAEAITAADVRAPRARGISSPAPLIADYPLKVALVPTTHQRPDSALMVAALGITTCRGGRTQLTALAECVPARMRQFAGWFSLGVVAFGAEVAILGALRQGLQCPLWLASAIAAEVVLLGRFLSTDRFVFGHARPTLARGWRFHTAAAGSFAVSWLVLNGSAVLLDVQYVVAAFLGSVAAFAWSGLTNFFWVWRPAPGAHLRHDRGEVHTHWRSETVPGSAPCTSRVATG